MPSIAARLVFVPLLAVLTAITAAAQSELPLLEDVPAGDVGIRLAAVDLDRFDDAREQFEVALATAEPALGEDHIYVLRLSYGLALALRGLEQREASDALLATVKERAAAVGNVASRSLAREVEVVLDADKGDR